MALPSCSVWLHKKVLHKYCKVPEGASFEARKSFLCVTTGISKGFIGNRKDPDFLVMNNSIPGFDMKGVSGSQIKVKYYGRKELFSNSRLCKPTYSCPKYFSTGGCLVNVDDQNPLVDNLVRESCNLPEDTAERRRNAITHVL